MFTTRLQVREAGSGQWVLLAPLTYFDRKTKLTLTVPSGFVTDYASIPKFARWLAPAHGKSAKPAALHDALLLGRASVGVDFRTADRIFRESLMLQGAMPTQAWLMWASVRLYGKLAYPKSETWGLDHLKAAAILAVAGVVAAPATAAVMITFGLSKVFDLTIGEFLR